MRGIMIDCSRNAVMSIQAVKRFVLLMEKLRFDTLMLYTEDTFEVDSEPLFGHMRGRYSKDELKELDTFCAKHGIELIPCIQTLAHLNSIFKWWSEYDCICDCDDILLADCDRTYTLIDNIFKTLSECFSSKKIHIGMDEAYKVGLGKHLTAHGFENRFDIINRHLHKVCELADKYDFKPMVWSDMFCKLVVESEDYYGSIDIEKIKAKAALPENTSLVYWDYYSTDYNRYVKMIKQNQAFDRPVVFAGGAWTWRGFAPDNMFSIETTTAALKACSDCGVDDIFITMWGDNGGECSRFAVLPALVYTAGILDKKTDSEIKKDFSDLTGMSFDDFMLLDRLDWRDDKRLGGFSKRMLYNDPFSGLFDHAVNGTEAEHYRELSGKLSAVAAAPEYKPLFNSAAALAKLLSVKSELGVKTRKAYTAGDKATLRTLAECDYTNAIKELDLFYNAYWDFWQSENKPNGFDVQDIRIGAMQKRIEACKARIISYCDGKTDCIPELCEKISDAPRRPSWSEMVTANNV